MTPYTMTITLHAQCRRRSWPHRRVVGFMDGLFLSDELPVNLSNKLRIKNPVHLNRFKVTVELGTCLSNLFEALVVCLATELVDECKRSIFEMLIEVRKTAPDFENGICRETHQAGGVGTDVGPGNENRER